MTRMARGNANDSFSTVEVTVLRALTKSIIVQHPDSGEDVVVGRSLLSYTSEEEVDSTNQFPAKLELEIRSWLVKKEGLES